MPRDEMIIIGAGTHACVVHDILSEMRDAPDVAGFIDVYSNPDLLDAKLDGLPVIGDGSVLEDVYKKGVHKAIVALGDNALRSEWFGRAVALGFEIVSAIHPFAYVSRWAKLGRGAMVSPGAVICTGAELGEAVIVNTSASVDHDCNIGAFCHVAPGANIAGNVIIGELSQIGIGACVRQRITIGRECMVGAGAAVVEDVEDGSVVAGVPAKALEMNGEEAESG